MTTPNLSSSGAVSSTWARRGVGCKPDSVLDVFVTEDNTYPWEIPADEYIKESRIGMRDGATPPGSRSWSILKKCLDTSAAIGVCEALFWISIMVIFPVDQKDKNKGDRSPSVNDIVNARHGDKTLSTDYLRDQLAKYWLTLTLEAKQGQDDFVLRALPHVYAQIVYRLMVDTFEHDRQHMVNHGDALIDKLSQLVHYELTGFRACAESHKRTRKQLFVGHVLNNPHVNQFEFLKGQKRQEELQHRVDAQQHAPLSFGNAEGDPLDPARMEHVMDQRSMNQESAANRASPMAGDSWGGTSISQLEYPDLSVDNYAFLTEVGQEVFSRQLHILEKSGVEKESDDGSRSPTSGGSSPKSPKLNRELKHSNKTWADGEGRAGKMRRSSALQEVMKQGSRQEIRKSVQAVMFLNRLSDDQRQQEEKAEAELQKQRESIIANAIVSELPQELRNRELYTTWVSPVAKRLKPGAEDRFMLKKPANEARHLQMAPPSPIMAGSVKLRRPKSTPSLPTSSSPPKLVQIHPHAQTHPQRRLSKNTSPGHANKDISEEGSHHGPKHLYLEPPQSISNEKVLERIQTQLETCRDASFGVYMKNFDILTGQRKQIFSDKRLFKEEATYVKKMEDLVRGTLRRNPTTPGEKPQGPPSDTAKFRRSKEYSAGALFNYFG